VQQQRASREGLHPVELGVVGCRAAAAKRAYLGQIWASRARTSACCCSLAGAPFVSLGARRCEGKVTARWASAVVAARRSGHGAPHGFPLASGSSTMASSCAPQWQGGSRPLAPVASVEQCGCRILRWWCCYPFLGGAPASMELGGHSSLSWCPPRGAVLPVLDRWSGCGGRLH
jgi:hypothetical protein